MLIRPSAPADLAAADAVLARAYPKLPKADYPPSVLVIALPVISCARPEVLACGTYYVDEVNGTVLGAGGWGLGAGRRIAATRRWTTSATW